MFPKNKKTQQDPHCDLLKKNLKTLDEEKRLKTLDEEKRL